MTVAFLLRSAIESALANRWDEAHKAVQDLESDPIAAHIHAVLHRIEGDESNARYWYRQARVTYRDSSPQEELREILEGLREEA